MTGSPDAAPAKAASHTPAPARDSGVLPGITAVPGAIGPAAAMPCPAGPGGPPLTGAARARAARTVSADIVIVDVETTGLVPAEAVIIEIGAVRLSGGQVTGEFFTLVSPDGPIPAGITGLTGITDEMVAAAPPVAAALRAFLAFARDSVLAAHNAPFDLAFLTGGCHACGLPWPPSAVLDTAVLARLLLRPGEVPDCKLGTLAAYFRAAATPSHRALADARATADVLLGLLDRAAAADPPRSPADIAALAAAAERPGSATAERPGSTAAERPGSTAAERPGNTASGPPAVSPAAGAAAGAWR